MNTVTSTTIVARPMFAARRKFAERQTFLIGGLDKETLFAKVRVDSEVIGIAENVIHKHSAFVAQEPEKKIQTIALSPSELGFVKRIPTREQIFDSVRLLQWSRENKRHLDGSVVGLLPEKTGPYIRYQYEDQPEGEILWVMMTLTTFFIIGRDADGKKWLNARHLRLEDRLGFGFRILFGLYEDSDLSN